jgi:hypothetical protein
MFKLSEARRTEFQVGNRLDAPISIEALSDAPLPVEAQTNCIASTDEDSSSITLFPV